MRLTRSDQAQSTLQMQLLGYAGLLPFLLCLGQQMHWLPSFIEQPEHVFRYYSSTILAFLAGSLWLRAPNSLTPTISNVFALIAFSALLSPLPLAIVFLALAFVALYGYEFYVLAQQDKSKPCLSYKCMRLALTLIVVSSHMLLFFNLGG
ncbi:DUF3429 domain-containing protein [Thalassotalea aquiviva]|uniref:DUF3429 domain-containing protein n=1 Tax=Thalassotalea aquiviva TaxID=3242415 RepID=UPI00352BCC9E